MRSLFSEGHLVHSITVDPGFRSERVSARCLLNLGTISSIQTFSMEVTMSERLYPLGFGRLAVTPAEGGVRIAITSELEAHSQNTFTVDGFKLEGGRRVRFSVSKTLDERRWPIDAVLVDSLVVTLTYPDTSTAVKKFEIGSNGDLRLIEKPARQASGRKAIRTAPARMTGANA